VWAHEQAHGCLVKGKIVNKEQKNKKDNYKTNQNYQEIPLNRTDHYKHSTTLITCVQQAVKMK
jgi:hypothetical protein